MKKLLLLLILIILLFNPIYAYDFERTIKTSELPYNKTQTYGLNINTSIDTLYLESSTSWISVPETINVNNQQNIMFNVSILIPEHINSQIYKESIIINSDVEETNFTFYFNIIDDENISLEKTDLTIEVRDVITEQILQNINLELTELTNDINVYNGTTAENGRYTFTNIKMNLWSLYIYATDYEKNIKINLNEINKLKIVYTLNNSVNLEQLESNLKRKILAKLIEEEMNELIDLQSSNTIFVNNTIFEPVYVNKDAYYESLKMNPENVKNLENSINSWKNQTLESNSLLRSCQDTNKYLNGNLQDCIEEKNQQKKQNIYNILKLIGIEFIIILIGCIVYFSIKKADISLMG